MFIQSIILNNYRVYKGLNKITFNTGGKNIFLISGNNGFGKTTFLTSLAWCLYGKLMVDVDEKYRRDINDAQGYKNYVRNSLSQSYAQELDAIVIKPEDKRRIQKNGYCDEFIGLDKKCKYFVQIELSDVYIPSIPCSRITITREYDYILDQEKVEVLIDGHVNELAKEVGYDIFINDFILSKDIAKFFLFDAEKIVTLAEVKSLEERRKLSTAYCEVLGIKKFEDIKRNLENLRIKFRKQSGVSVNSSQLEKAAQEVERLELTIREGEEQIASIDASLLKLKANKDQIQEKLIREGNAMSLEELAKQKDLLKTLKEKDHALKNQLREMLDIAPFAIAGKLFTSLKEQSDRERSAKSAVNAVAEINHALNETRTQLLNTIKADLGFQNYQYLGGIIDDVFMQNMRINQESNCTNILLDYSLTESNELQALYDNIRLSYTTVFKQLVKDIKNTALFISKTQKKISSAEMDESDIQIKSLRAARFELDKKIAELEDEARSISEKRGVLNKDLAVNKKRLSELTKLVKVDSSYKEKDAIAERLISELEEFLLKLRINRKTSLECRIKDEMDKLMHKIDFIHSVNVSVLNDMIDIRLIDKDGYEINKEKLSMGERQLYATAILKSLVDESGISFPVFIDSPLQKFDNIHAHNIITKFYPTVSKQVVIFPLLGKELSEEEYHSLLPNINSTFIIESINGNSKIIPVPTDKLFA